MNGSTIHKNIPIWKKSFIKKICLYISALFIAVYEFLKCIASYALITKKFLPNFTKKLLLFLGFFNISFTVLHFYQRKKNNKKKTSAIVHKTTIYIFFYFVLFNPYCCHRKILWVTSVDFYFMMMLLRR